ncbi:PH domain-containing protein [Staphylococcus aureus]|uniref:PH domain-containing protein n=1 Tax=Staphylococcus aureus TaxID=1280 RepID=UPI001CF30BF3|nr:PH domain-containing protein [Staphylococcus aureus]MBZ8163137.1 PH domain-containing protein [Staphylococcus aureus]MBZ8165884.1 PH domain-containing protein [Staphylococcus aureus]MBZ8168746.1 PH domain-containing protein [Staphylococcus aureus]MBZ8171308.1 PH domain-containing protein [Staphylococcus aureus]HDG8718380.1 PH domain-containing protein [Staphylococcus aureus]
MKKTKLDISVKKYWYLSESIISFCILSIIATLLIIVYFNKNYPVTLLILTISFFLVLISFLINCIFINNIKYNLFSYNIEVDFIEINRGGKLFKTHIVIPLKEVNYIDISTNILMKKYNICKLKIATLAYEHEIEGIQIKTALRYKKELKKSNLFNQKKEVNKNE